MPDNLMLAAAETIDALNENEGVKVCARTTAFGFEGIWCMYLFVCYVAYISYAAVYNSVKEDCPAQVNCTREDYQIVLGSNQIVSQFTISLDGIMIALSGVFLIGKMLGMIAREPLEENSQSALRSKIFTLSNGIALLYVITAGLSLYTSNQVRAEVNDALLLSNTTFPPTQKQMEDLRDVNQLGGDTTLPIALALAGGVMYKLAKPCAYLVGPPANALYQWGKRKIENGVNGLRDCMSTTPAERQPLNRDRPSIV